MHIADVTKKKSERVPFSSLSTYLHFVFENTKNISIKFGPGASGVARYFDARGKQSQWPPLTEIMNFKKITIIYLISFYLAT